jgi:uncharacterized heparinase superfamily protein
MGADRFAHAGTLSFELSIGRERLIVNCGAAPAADEQWREALRATAAHSTLVLADTNSSELKPDGLGRRPERVTAERVEHGGQFWLDLTHDGWRKPYGMLHRRRLYLSATGEDLRGEDILEPVEVKGEVQREPKPGPAEVPPFAVRFHLHPGVLANLQQDESSVLLRLPSGQGWRLRAQGCRVELEESVYLGTEPRRTSQVALHAETGSSAIQWALSRIGTAGEEPPAPGQG